jgi:hypothetical protein
MLASHLCPYGKPRSVCSVSRDAANVLDGAMALTVFYVAPPSEKQNTEPACE